MPKAFRSVMPRASGDVANAHAWIVCDAGKDTGVVGEKTPFSHGTSLAYSGNYLLV